MRHTCLLMIKTVCHTVLQLQRCAAVRSLSYIVQAAHSKGAHLDARSGILEWEFLSFADDALLEL